jgi:hypothetical protein
MYPTATGVRLTLCLLLACVVSGCSKESASKGTLTGTVTFDGAPITSGTIRFDPVDGRTASADSMITDGKYSATAAPGEKRVTISAQKVVGKKKAYDTPESPVIELTEEMIPKRYNAQSELKHTVKAGSEEKNFDLTSK